MERLYALGIVLLLLGLTACGGGGGGDTEGPVGPNPISSSLLLKNGSLVAGNAPDASSSPEAPTLSGVPISFVNPDNSIIQIPVSINSSSQIIMLFLQVENESSHFEITPESTANAGDTQNDDQKTPIEITVPEDFSALDKEF